MSEASGGDQPISNQLANLVPTFDPSKDDTTIYQQKVELVLAAWPKNRVTELVTRLILNCQGTAFQKLQLHQEELLKENDPKLVHRLINILGGQWGKVSLEKQYLEAEAALFNTVQKPDESNDSYLARSDVHWMKLLAQKIKLEDLQAYVVLRGSQLSPEDKKKVILVSDSSLEGRLTMTRVSEAIRLLGASFFQDMTGTKKTAKTKVYENSVLQAEDVTDEQLQDTFVAQPEEFEEDFIDGLLNEGDEDATLVADFEMAASETLQEDQALAEALTAYQDARRRLSEKFRNRGFWPTSKGSSQPSKGKGYKGSGGHKGRGKGKFAGRSRRSLEDRILNSHCRICLRQGHWKAECPYRGTGNAPTSSPPTTTGAVPTTTTVIEAFPDEPDVLPMEFLNLPKQSPIDQDDTTKLGNESQGNAVVYHVHAQYQGSSNMIHGESSVGNLGIVGVGHVRLKQRLLRSDHATVKSESVDPIRNASARLRQKVPTIRVKADNPTGQAQSSPNHDQDKSEDIACFATYGAMGVLDSGASKTVIGSDHVSDLIESLSPAIRRSLTRVDCNITFRFGNQGTLQSHGNSFR